MSCGVDASEPNDDETSATALGAIEDEPIGEGTLPQTVSVSRSLHDADDVDFFSLEIEDTGFIGNPRVTLVVTRGLQATVVPRCKNGQLESLHCSRGEPSMDPPSCTSEPPDPSSPPGAAAVLSFQVECANASSDDLAVGVVVTRSATPSACAPYKLTVSAE